MNRREIRHVLAVLAAREEPDFSYFWLILLGIVVSAFLDVMPNDYYQEHFARYRGEFWFIAPIIIFAGPVSVGAVLGKRESFLAVLQDARPAVGSARLLMAAMLVSLIGLSELVVYALVWLVCTQAFLLATWSGGDGLAAYLQQVRLEDYAFVPDITLIFLLCAFFALPLAVFVLWSLINARPGYLRSCWHNLPNLACCAVVLAGYWLVASFAGFSFFEPGNPPALLFGYLALAALCYSLAASHAVRTAAADPGRLYFSELWSRWWRKPRGRYSELQEEISQLSRWSGWCRKPRGRYGLLQIMLQIMLQIIKFDMWLNKNSWFILLVFVVLIVWCYYVR